MLHQILDRVEFVTYNKYEEELFSAIFVTAYYGMFRVGELVESCHAVKRHNVLSDNEGIVHFIQHSSRVMKPGQIPPIVEIKLKGVKHCPTRLVNKFSKRRVILQTKTNPVQFFVHQDGKVVTKHQVLKVLHKAIHLVSNCEASDFGTHSLRVGRATNLWC